jgi:hypothetical protein
VVKTRTNSHRRVFTWFVSRWRNHQPKRAEKPHSIIQSPQGAGRPCYEADNSACRGDQNKIGLGISVFVSVESSDHSEAWLKTFASAVSAMPEVMEFYRMAGDVDYMLRVVVADMASYDVFYKKLISAVPLKNVTSRFAMEKIKSVTALPVPAA